MRINFNTGNEQGKLDQVIPFGKYRGQPVSQLMHDKEYAEWLLTQPWFVERYGNLKTIIINNFKEPNETPEHNNMQAQFLNDEFAMQFLLSSQNERLFFSLDNESCNYITDDTPYRYVQISRRYLYDHEYLSNRSANCEVKSQFKHLAEIDFETETGWDVSIHVINDIEFLIKYLSGEDKIEKTSLHAWFYLELKPVLADDYPRVLREVKSRMKKLSIREFAVVFAEKFQSQAVSLAEAKQIFSKSDIQLVTLQDLPDETQLIYNTRHKKTQK